MHRLFSFSTSIKNEASEILETYQVLTTLERYGNVCFAGSFAYDLMFSPDIDIYVVNPNITKKSVQEVLQKFITDGRFNGYLFYDYVHFTREGFPTGYYLGLKSKINGKKWKIDIWFLTADLAERKKSIDELGTLSDPEKLTVLKLKAHVQKHNLDIPSIRIYDAVIKHHVKTVNDFNLFLRSHPQ